MLERLTNSEGVLASDIVEIQWEQEGIHSYIYPDFQTSFPDSKNSRFANWIIAEGSRDLARDLGHLDG